MQKPLQTDSGTQVPSLEVFKRQCESAGMEAIQESLQESTKRLAAVRAQQLYEHHVKKCQVSKILGKSLRPCTCAQNQINNKEINVCNNHFLDARFRNPPIGGFKHVECLCGTPGIVSLLKTWFFQLCIIAATLFWSNSMDTFNGLIVLRIHF